MRLLFIFLLASCATVSETKPYPWYFYENGEVAIQESLTNAIQSRVSEPSFEKCLVKGEENIVKVDIKAKILASGQLGFIKAVSDSDNLEVKTCVKDYLSTMSFNKVPGGEDVNFHQKFVFKITPKAN